MLAKLLYASPAWWGFATTANKQRIEYSSVEVFGSAMYGDGYPTATQLAEDADESLLNRIKYCTTNIMSCNSFFQSSTVATTVFDLDITTSS